MDLFGFRKKKTEPPQPAPHSGREHDKFMRHVYKMVSVHRDSDAIILLMDEYDYLQTTSREFEDLYRHVEQWGPSRSLQCIARLIIYKLDREKRFDKALIYIEKSQAISPMFVLPELARVTFYARQAIDAGKLGVAKNLVVEHETRYRGLVGGGECERLLRLLEPDIDVTLFGDGS